MTLEAALDEFELHQRRRYRGEEGQTNALALAALREFLIEDTGHLETAEITPRDLYRFLFEYYPAQEDADPEVGEILLEAVAALAEWLVERGERGLAPVVARDAQLREDVPRILEAQALLMAHARRDDLRAEAEITEEEGEEAVGSVTSGVDRVARLDQINYDEAQLEYFTVQRIADASLSLTSVERDVLSEGPAEPVAVPARAAELLHAGDIIHAEIAPGPAGWELLEVFGVRPGGYL